MALLNLDQENRPVTRDEAVSPAQYSRFMTLEPGDLVLTGTPAGVGPLAPGDVVEVEIPGIGILSNPVVADSR